MRRGSSARANRAVNQRNNVMLLNRNKHGHSCTILQEGFCVNAAFFQASNWPTWFYFAARCFAIFLTACLCVFAWTKTLFD